MDQTNINKGTGNNDDDYRQKNKEDGKTNENGEERPQDGRTEEEEQRKFEKEMLEWHDKQPKMNRSGPPKHSTLVGGDLLKEINKEEEKEGDKVEEDTSVEIVEVRNKEVERRKEEQGDSYWQDIEKSVLTAFLPWDP
uniref:High mobility group nucleosome-binding domain-containing protein 5-like n=1 Tax=Diabrotica virgifera virgifera TaxID=50390 RepID=A0A6P7H6X6_DIAVI